MEVFINEHSFHEQIHSREEFEASARIFFNGLDVINTAKIKLQIFQKQTITHFCRALANELLVASLNSLSDRSLKTAINNILYNKLNVRDWTEDQLHSSEIEYEWMGEIVTDSSIAELAERILSVAIEFGFLLNFPESRFAGYNFIDILKKETEIPVVIVVACCNERSAIEELLENNFQISRFVYDIKSDNPPSDTQTILRDEARFIRTNHAFEGGRRVYQEVTSGRYWYVDNLHYGRAAHLEVFDANGRHLGEADLEGNINDQTKNLNRRILL